MMIIAAIVTDFSLYLLCSCSRRTGAQSYGEVCLLAFGKGFELFTTFLLFVFLMFVVVAYMVLIKNIWTPVIGDFFLTPLKPILFGTTVEETGNGGIVYSETSGNMILLFLVVLMLPFMLRKDLHALRYNCYVGFASISILCIAMVRRAYQKCVSKPSIDSDSILWSTHSFTDGLYAFPIIMLAFLSAFNVNPVQAALVRPSRQRMRSVISLSIVSCFTLMYIFGLAGYLFARSKTEGNILLNFDVGDNLIIFGRIGSGLTILMAMPMMILPCRQSILEFIPNFINWIRKDDKNSSYNGDVEQMNETSSLAQNLQDGTTDKNSFNAAKKSKKEHAFHPIIHFVTTITLVTICYIFAIAAPGVAVVWSICGSSMAFLIAFIIPCACYIEIRQFKAGVSWYNSKILGSWFLLIFSTIGAIACTVQTVWRLLYSNN